MPFNSASDAFQLHPDVRSYGQLPSGDCRPSKRFAAAARGVDVMIHEATFEDALRSHAVKKRHSTSAEALAIARASGAKHVVLTHFSQRYPRAAAVKAADGGGDAADGDGDDAGDDVVTAFDGMRLRWDALRSLPGVMGRVRAMFDAYEAHRAAEREDH